MFFISCDIIYACVVFIYVNVMICELVKCENFAVKADEYVVLAKIASSSERCHTFIFVTNSVYAVVFAVEWCKPSSPSTGQLVSDTDTWQLMTWLAALAGLRFSSPLIMWSRMCGFSIVSEFLIYWAVNNSGQCQNAYLHVCQVSRLAGQTDSCLDLTQYRHESWHLQLVFYSLYWRTGLLTWQTATHNVDNHTRHW